MEAMDKRLGLVWARVPNEIRQGSNDTLNLEWSSLHNLAYANSGRLHILEDRGLDHLALH